MPLIDLLDYLAQAETLTEPSWNDWRITRIGGGWNNLLYRATNPEHDYAIKFTLRDARNRAQREFVALSALRDAGLQIAPDPIVCEPDRYKLPVVVQSWLANPACTTPPTNDRDWTHLLEHLAASHTLTPEKTRLDLPIAVVTAHTFEQAKSRVREQFARLPEDARPESATELITRLEQLNGADWENHRVTLCRVDPNITNFLRGEPQWQSVDGENAGWGDPACEIADMMAHPAYENVSPSRWDWVIAKIGALENDSQMAERIRAYYRTILAWWVVRFARYAYETPRGQDARLVNRPANWYDHIQNQYARYLDLAHATRQAPDSNPR